MSVTTGSKSTDNTDTDHRTNIIPFKRLKPGCILPFKTAGLEKPSYEPIDLEGTTPQGREIVRKLILIHKKAASSVQRQLRHEFLNVPINYHFSPGFYRRLVEYLRTHKSISRAEVVQMVGEDEFPSDFPEESRWSDDSCGYRHPRSRHFAGVPGKGGMKAVAVTKQNVREVLENEVFND